MHRRQFLTSLTTAVALSQLPLNLFGKSNDAVDYDVDLRVPCQLFDGKSCWAHPRGALWPTGKGKKATFIMALLDLTGNDIFPGMYRFDTTDGGKTFSTPVKIESLSVAPQEIDGKIYHVGPGDIVPKLHTQTTKILATGNSLCYDAVWKPASPKPKRTTYAVFDEVKNDWGEWAYLNVPDSLNYRSTGAGCGQRVDLPDGSILLPVSFKKPVGNSGVTVMHCSFDGKELKYMAQGNELFIQDETRGLGEPSLVLYNGLYYLTVRHNERAYVSTSRDGLQFEPLRPWMFDDGTDLGSYNTQQHWVAYRRNLYLAYTRRGANNDYVFRNRAPLFMAEVDTKKLTVIRKTEKTILPNLGARYGNFGVCQLSDKESWITDSEWMQPKGCEKYGSNGRVYVARIQ